MHSVCAVFRRRDAEPVLTDATAAVIFQYASENPRDSRNRHICRCKCCRSIALGGRRSSARIAYQVVDASIVAIRFFCSDHDEKTTHKARRYQLCLSASAVDGDFRGIPVSSDDCIHDLLNDERAWTPAGLRARRHSERDD